MQVLLGSAHLHVVFYFILNNPEQHVPGVRSALPGVSKGHRKRSRQQNVKHQKPSQENELYPRVPSGLQGHQMEKRRQSQDNPCA